MYMMPLQNDDIFQELALFLKIWLLLEFSLELIRLGSELGRSWLGSV